MSDSILRYKAEAFGNEKYLLGESPFYDERTGFASFVDISRNMFYRFRPEDMKLFSFAAREKIGAAVPAEKPGYYVFAASDGLYLFDGQEMSLLADLSQYYKKWQRSNDAKADPRGRLFFGSSSDDEKFGANGNLFCYDSLSAQKISVVQKDTKISNGMAWNSACDTFFFSDSLEHCVFAYDYDAISGICSNRHVLFTVQDGVPDGMCIDSDDNLWLAVWDGSRIEKRDSKTGKLLALVETDALHTSSCCFMGDGLLLITSSGDGLAGEHDGCLFTCRVDAKAGTSHFFHI